MVKVDSVNDKEAFWYGRALEYLGKVSSASQSDICRKIGLKYDYTKLLVHYLLDKGLIQSAESDARNHLGLTSKGMTALTFYKKWKKELGVD